MENQESNNQESNNQKANKPEKIKKSNKEWKKILPQDKFQVLRLKHTETSGTGKLLHNKETGTYLCGACHLQLFKSNTKFDSGTGWPSFYDAIPGHLDYKKELDGSIEVQCARCNSHLGHVFHDSPETPTGNRYCINSLALDFEKQE